MKEIEDKINGWIDYHKWNLSEKRSLIAVSGGKDSMTLAEYYRRHDYPMEIAHINYHFRPEADEESEMVKNWADKYDILFHRLDLDGPAELAKNNENLQEWARQRRYEFFESIRKQNKLNYIATAHHLDDNVETLLMRLLQSSGLKGLSGIPASRGKIIRPFLTISREEIDALQKAWDIPYRQDSSNLKMDYKRNEIRHNLGKFLKENYPNSFSNISKSIFYLSESLPLYEVQKNKRISKLLQKDGYLYRLSIAALEACSPRETLIYELFSPFGFSSKQIPEIEKLLRSQSGHGIESADFRIIRDRKHLILAPLTVTSNPVLSINDSDSPIKNETINFTMKKMVRTDKNKNSANEIYINPAKISFPMIIRPWRKGDYFYPEGLNKKKKVSDYFNDIKLNQIQKEQVQILQSGDHIVALLGYRMDHRFLVPENGESIRIRYKRK